MHAQCDARLMVTFPAHPGGTKLCCLVTGAEGHEQVTQSCYTAAS